MPGNAYELFGGPCHWDLVLHFYVVLGFDLAVDEECLDGNGNIRERRLNVVSRRYVKQLERAFHRFYNPDWDPERKRGKWKLYEFAPCCSFHLDATFEVAPATFRGQRITKESVRQLLPEHYGVIVIEDLAMNANPHADLHGKIVVISPSDITDTSFPHELGHIMGLPDQHRHAHIQVPPDEEQRHRGHLMGTAVNGRREIAQHEIDEIAAHTGMTCDKETCCRKDRRGAAEEEPRRKRRGEVVRTPCTRDPYPGGVIRAWDYVLAGKDRRNK